MKRFIDILIDIIMDILYIAAGFVFVSVAIFIILFPFYLMVRVSSWFILIYIAYIIFLIFIYLLIKNK